MISSVQALPRCFVMYIARRNRVPSRILPRWMIVLALLNTSPSSSGRSISPSSVVSDEVISSMQPISPGIVHVPGRRLGIAAKVLAEQIAGDPFRVLSQNLMVDVVEQLELDRVARPLDRLDAIDHRAAHAADEIVVEKGDRGVQPPGQLRLPLPPGVEIEIGPRHPAAVLIENVQIVAAGQGRGVEVVQIEMPLGIDRPQLPTEHPPGVVGVVLRVAARAKVENDAAAALLGQAGVGELQAELRLADAGRSDHGRQRARQQPAAEQIVKSVDAGGEANMGELDLD